MEVQSEAEPISPLLSIWVRPRETIRRIVDTDPSRHVVLLAVVSGFVAGVSGAYSQDWPASWPLLVPLAVGAILGPIMSIIGLYIGGALYRWTGSVLGGEASTEQVRAALAWSSVPGIVGSAFAMSPYLIFGTGLSTLLALEMDSSLFLLMSVLYFGILAGLAIWAFVVQLKCLGEVHRFSAWRAWGATILGDLVVGLPLACIFVLFGIAFGTFS